MKAVFTLSFFIKESNLKGLDFYVRWLEEGGQMSREVNRYIF